MLVLSFLWADEVSLSADSLKYVNQSVVLASGNVSLEYGDFYLQAERLSLYSKESFLTAEGNISVNVDGKNYRAQSLTYKLKDKELILNTLSTTLNIEQAASPVYFKCKRLTKDNDVFYGDDSCFTTCPPDKPYYEVEAKKFKFYPDDKIIAREVFVHSGSLPVFYSPYYEFYVGKKNPIYLLPAIGNNNEEGFYVKNTLEYWLNEDIKSQLIIDYLEKKDLGLGVKTKFFEKKNYPLDLYIYNINNYNFILSLAQKLKIANTEEVSYKINRRNLYSLYGNRDDFLEYNLNLSNTKSGQLSLLERNNYYLSQKHQELNWQNTDKSNTQNLQLVNDSYFLSKAEYQMFKYNVVNTTFSNEFYYRNSDYYMTRTKYQYISNKIKVFLQGNNLVLANESEYKKTGYFGREAQLVSPKFSLLYYPQKAGTIKEISKIVINMNTNINLNDESITTNKNLEVVENLPEASIEFSEYDFNSVNLKHKVTMGSYHEKKNIGFSRDIYDNRVLMQNVASTYLYKNINKSNYLLYTVGYDQYLYDSGDKQFLLGNKLDLGFKPIETVKENIVYEKSDPSGYSQFYFDELRSRINKISNYFNYEYVKYLNLIVEDSYSFLDSKRDLQKFTISYLPEEKKQVLFSTAYNYETRVWSNLINRLTYKQDEYNYVIMNNSYSLMRGEIMESLVQFGCSIGLEERWLIKADLLWNSLQKQYRVPMIRIIKDLGCVVFSYEYNDIRREHTLMFKVTAFPDELTGISTGSEGLNFKGFTNSSGNR